DRLVFDVLKKDGTPVVVDALALRDAGLAADTPLPSPPASPFWEGLGLVHVPFPEAALLTTRRQEEAWRTGGTESVQAAVAEAVRYGHARSGRFRDVADWLAEKRVEGGPGPDLGPLTAGGGPGWAAWEPVAGTGPGEGLWVVRTASLPWLGVVLAA